MEAPVKPPAGSVCNYYKYIAMLPPGTDRAALKKIMRERHDVGLSGEVYETPCHQQPVFASASGGSLPMAEELCARHICLPVSAKMTAEDARYVLEALESAIDRLDAAPARAKG